MSRLSKMAALIPEQDEIHRLDARLLALLTPHTPAPTQMPHLRTQVDQLEKYLPFLQKHGLATPEHITALLQTPNEFCQAMETLERYHLDNVKAYVLGALNHLKEFNKSCELLESGHANSTRKLILVLKNPKDCLFTLKKLRQCTRLNDTITDAALMHSKKVTDFFALFETVQAELPQDYLLHLLESDDLLTNQEGSYSRLTQTLIDARKAGVTLTQSITTMILFYRTPLQHVIKHLKDRCHYRPSTLRQILHLSSIEHIRSIAVILAEAPMHYNRQDVGVIVSTINDYSYSFSQPQPFPFAFHAFRVGIKAIEAEASAEIIQLSRSEKTNIVPTNTNQTTTQPTNNSHAKIKELKAIKAICRNALHELLPRSFKATEKLILKYTQQLAFPHQWSPYRRVPGTQFAHLLRHLRKAQQIAGIPPFNWTLAQQSAPTAWQALGINQPNSCEVSAQRFFRFMTEPRSTAKIPRAQDTFSPS